MIFDVPRTDRLKWNRSGRFNYLLQCLGNRAMRDGWTNVIRRRYRKIEEAKRKARLNERIELAKSLGWTDLREVRFGGCDLVLRGFRTVVNSGVQVHVRDTVPEDDCDIISLTNVGRTVQ